MDKEKQGEILLVIFRVSCALGLPFLFRELTDLVNLWIPVCLIAAAVLTVIIVGRLSDDIAEEISSTVFYCCLFIYVISAELIWSRLALNLSLLSILSYLLCAAGILVLFSIFSSERSEIHDLAGSIMLASSGGLLMLLTLAMGVLLALIGPLII